MAFRLFNVNLEAGSWVRAAATAHGETLRTLQLPLTGQSLDLQERRVEQRTQQAVSQQPMARSWSRLRATSRQVNPWRLGLSQLDAGVLQNPIKVVCLQIGHLRTVNHPVEQQGSPGGPQACRRIRSSGRGAPAPEDAHDPPGAPPQPVRQRESLVLGWAEGEGRGQEDHLHDPHRFSGASWASSSFRVWRRSSGLSIRSCRIPSDTRCSRWAGSAIWAAARP